MSSLRLLQWHRHPLGRVLNDVCEQESFLSARGKETHQLYGEAEDPRRRLVDRLPRRPDASMPLSTRSWPTGAGVARGLGVRAVPRSQKSLVERNGCVLRHRQNFFSARISEVRRGDPFFRFGARRRLTARVFFIPRWRKMDTGNCDRSVSPRWRFRRT